MTIKSITIAFLVAVVVPGGLLYLTAKFLVQLFVGIGRMRLTPEQRNESMQQIARTFFVLGRLCCASGTEHPRKKVHFNQSLEMA